MKRYWVLNSLLYERFQISEYITQKQKFDKVKAICVVSPAGKPCHGGVESSVNCTGVINFEQSSVGGPTTITFKISGLTPGLHGFHVHEFADFSNGCISAGPHFNPFKKTHGSPTDEERHVGDLGNIEAGSDGVATGEIVDPLIQLVGEYSVVGRSIMIHADPDDLGKGGHALSATTGNAGARIACGEIKLVE